MNTIDILIAFSTREKAIRCYKEMATASGYFNVDYKSLSLSDTISRYRFVSFDREDSLQGIMGWEFTAVIFEDDLPESQRRYILSRVRKRVFN